MRFPALAILGIVVLGRAALAGEPFEFRHHFISLDLPSNNGQGDYGLTALADLDGDGDLDFVCGGRIPQPERLYWFEYRRQMIGFATMWEPLISPMSDWR